MGETDDAPNRTLAMPARHVVILLGSSMLGGMFAGLVASIVDEGSALLVFETIRSNGDNYRRVVGGTMVGLMGGLLAFATLGLLADSGEPLPRTWRGWSMVGIGAGALGVGAIFVVAGQP